MKTKLIQTDSYYLLVDEESEIKEGDYYLWLDNLTSFCKADEMFLMNESYRKQGLIAKIIAHLPKGNAPKLEGVDLLPEFIKTEICFLCNGEGYFENRNFISEKEECCKCHGTGKLNSELPIEYYKQQFKEKANEALKLNSQIGNFGKSNDEKDVEQLANKAFDKDYKEEDLVDTEDDTVYCSFLDGFNKGYKAAKQSKKKYSEEDIIKALFKGFDYCLDNMTKDSSEITNQNVKDFFQSLSTNTPIDFEVEIWAHTEENPQPKVINGVLQGIWIY